MDPTAINQLTSNQRLQVAHHMMIGSLSRRALMYAYLMVNSHHLLLLLNCRSNYYCSGRNRKVMRETRVTERLS